MAEIAEDVGMSAANLYRYFENKQDLAAACASRCIGDQVDLLRDVVRRPGLGASERLERFVLETLRYTFEHTQNRDKVDELVEIVARDRTDIVHQKNRAMCALLAEILAMGNESGEFEVRDVIQTAGAVYTATVAFGVPIFMTLYSLQEFEDKARNVVRLLIRGLEKR
jgi:AcrR family transcriptional regulator